MHVWLKSIITSQHIIIHNLRTYVYSYSILICSVISFLVHAWILSCLVRGCFVLSCPGLLGIGINPALLSMSCFLLICLVFSCHAPVMCIVSCLLQDFPVVSCHVLFALSCIISCFFLSCFSGLVFIYPTLSSLFLSDLVMNCIICIVPAFYSIVLGICLLYYLRYPKFVFEISLCHDLPSSCSLQILIMQPIPSYIS